MDDGHSDSDQAEIKWVYIHVTLGFSMGLDLLSAAFVLDKMEKMLL